MTKTTTKPIKKDNGTFSESYQEAANRCRHFSTREDVTSTHDIPAKHIKSKLANMTVGLEEVILKRWRKINLFELITYTQRY